MIDWLGFVKDVDRVPYDKDDASWGIKYQVLYDKLDEAFVQHYAYLEEHRKKMEETPLYVM